MASGPERTSGINFLMEKPSHNDCSCANEAAPSPSFLSEDWRAGPPRAWRIPLKLSIVLMSLSILLGGCGVDAPKPAQQAETKPTEPVIPEEIQAAAKALLGSESQVLVFGDQAKNGKQQFLAANVVPKTPANSLPGTIVTRAFIAENNDGKWTEIFRCDEHLKNPKGYLGLTPLAPVTGWRLQFEQNAEKGLQLYFTPLQGTTDSHVLPIGVRWNPATKRYQSLDRTYEHFLLESPALNDVRSRLR